MFVKVEQESVEEVYDGSNVFVKAGASIEDAHDGSKVFVKAGPESVEEANDDSDVSV